MRSKPTPSFRIAPTVVSDDGYSRNNEDDNGSIHSGDPADTESLSEAVVFNGEEEGDVRKYQTTTSVVVTSARYLPAPKPSGSSKYLEVPTPKIPEPTMQPSHTRDRYTYQRRVIT
jgi:hypothetical protein